MERKQDCYTYKVRPSTNPTHTAFFLLILAAFVAFVSFWPKQGGQDKPMNKYSPSESR